MALLIRSSNTRIMCFVLVLVITYATFPSCEAGNSNPPTLLHIYAAYYIYILFMFYLYWFLFDLLCSVSCVLGIKGNGSPSLLSMTCYTFRDCTREKCGKHCVHKGKKEKDCECRPGPNEHHPAQCCCQDN